MIYGRNVNDSRPKIKATHRICSLFFVHNSFLIPVTSERSPHVCAPREQDLIYVSAVMSAGAWDVVYNIETEGKEAHDCRRLTFRLRRKRIFPGSLKVLRVSNSLSDMWLATDCR